MALIFPAKHRVKRIIIYSIIFLVALLFTNNSTDYKTSETSDDDQSKPSTRFDPHFLSTQLHYSSISPSQNHLPTTPSVSFLSRFSMYNRKQHRQRNNHHKVESNFPRSLDFWYYRDSCPQVEQVIRSVVLELNRTQSDVVPSILRLVFHDCFVEGCDASLLLDSVDGIPGEKEASPNADLKGYDIIDQIKSKLEEACPGVVSCADILVLAAREAVVMGGGPSYPLRAGRRDSTMSFPEVAEYEFPSSQDNLLTTLASIAAKGFNDREMVALLGSHSMGAIHCSFFSDHLQGLNTNEPSVMSSQFLNLMISACGNGNNAVSPTSFISEPPESVFDESIMEDSYGPSPSSVYEAEAPAPAVETQVFNIKNNAPSQLPPLPPPSSPTSSSVPAPSPFNPPFLPVMKMDYRGPLSVFRDYASDARLSQQDLAQAMMKLSNLGVLIAPLGQVRLDCRRVV